MLSVNLEQTLSRALNNAADRRHKEAGLEHLLFALIEDPHAVAVLVASNLDLAKLRKDVSEFLDDEANSNLDPSGSRDPRPSAGFQRVVQRAAIHVQSSGRDEVTGANVLVALFGERESHAVYFLQMQDMTRLDAVNFISHGIGKVPGLSVKRQPERPRAKEVDKALEPQRDRWEYRVNPFDREAGPASHVAQQMLDAWGKDGFECFAIAEGAAWFKRRRA